MDNDLLAIEEDDFLDADDTRGDFFDFLEQGNTQADAGVAALQGVVGMDGNVHDRNFGGRGTEENHDTNGVGGAPVAVVGEERLGFMIPDADGQSRGSFFQARVAELRERIDDALANLVLAGIKE